MLDIQLFRDEPEKVREGLAKRQLDTDVVDQVIEMDQQRRELIQKVEAMRAEKNTSSKEIGQIRNPKDREQIIAAMRILGEKLDSAETELSELEPKLEALLATLPNLPDPRVPIGADESENVVQKTIGELPEFEFEPKAHWDLGPELGILDFERGVKLSGTRFYVLNGAGARLQRALVSFMLDTLTRQGYEERYTPFMVKEEVVYASGQLPKFGDNLYRDIEEDFWWVPTAEVPLTSLHKDEILEESALPISYTAYTPCFRREKISAGREVRGIKRGHQFDKVEMYVFCQPEDSEDQFKRLLTDAERICQLLELPYRVSNQCTGDLGFAAAYTSDIEVWAAGCQEWLEVSSISNTRDFQARRAAIRYYPEGSKNTRFVNTLNGSGLGLPRVLIAVLENNQREDGSVVVPEALYPWMGGIEIIEP